MFWLLQCCNPINYEQIYSIILINNKMEMFDIYDTSLLLNKPVELYVS